MPPVAWEAVCEQAFGCLYCLGPRGSSSQRLPSALLTLEAHCTSGLCPELPSSRASCGYLLSSFEFQPKYHFLSKPFPDSCVEESFLTPPQSSPPVPITSRSFIFFRALLTLRNGPVHSFIICLPLSPHLAIHSCPHHTTSPAHKCSQYVFLVLFCLEIIVESQEIVNKTKQNKNLVQRREKY